MKKTLAILLAAVMLLAMSAVAMAATPTGNITVNKVENGAKAVAYQLIKWNLDENGNPTDPSNEWANTEVATWMTAKGYAKVADLEGLSDDQKNKLFNDMYKDVVGGTLNLTEASTVTATSTSVTFNGLEIGTYLIKLTSDNTVYNAVVANVGYTFSNGAWTVKENNSVDAKAYSVPVIDKKINEKDTADGHDPDHSDTVEIGEVVTFDIYAPVPNYPDDATWKHFRIYDIMCEGLTFNAGSLKVYGVPATGDTALLEDTIDYDMQTTAGMLFDLVFKYDQIKAYSKIHITYTATVNEKAKLGTNENTNEVTLEYQNNPYIENDYKEKKDEVRVFTFKLNVDKVDGKDKTTPLAGAEFELYHSENDAKNGTNPVMFVAKDDGTYRFAKKDDTPTTKTLVTDASGNIKVEGLKDGTYWLKETKAPAEYNKAVNPFEVKLEQMKDNENKGTANLKNGDATIKYQKNEKIENNKGTIIPSTGGMGTTVFMVAGIVIMACAVVTLMLLLKRQKNGSEG